MSGEKIFLFLWNLNASAGFEPARSPTFQADTLNHCTRAPARSLNVKQYCRSIKLHTQRSLQFPFIDLSVFTLTFCMLRNRLSYLNFHSLEVVSRCRDPQLQAGENYSHLFNFRQKICRITSTSFVFWASWNIMQTSATLLHWPTVEFMLARRLRRWNTTKTRLESACCVSEFNRCLICEK